MVLWLCAVPMWEFFFVCLFLHFSWASHSTEKLKIYSLKKTSRSINWNVSRLPPLDGILQWFKRLWSTSEEILHTVQSIHCRAWMQIYQKMLTDAICHLVCCVDVLRVCCLPSTTSITHRPSRDGTWLAAAVWTAMAPPMLWPIIMMGGGASP